MTHRSRVVTPAILLLFLLAAVVGVRTAVRELASPFEALERLARLPKASAPDPDSEFAEAIRQIDWEEVAPTVMAAGSGSNSARASVYASKPAHTLLVGEVLRLAAKQVVLDRTLLELDLSVTFTLSNDLTLDTLAASLKLSESQKARISELMEWRKWSLDALTEAEKSDSERMKKIEDWYHEAMKRELDQI